MNTSRFCTTCGQPRSPSAAFCGACGQQHDTAGAGAIASTPSSAARAPRKTSAGNNWWLGWLLFFLMASTAVMVIWLVAPSSAIASLSGATRSLLRVGPPPPPPIYQSEAVGPLLVEARSERRIGIAMIPVGMRVNGALSVAFNRFCVGTPDIDVRVLGPNGGTILSIPAAVNGVTFAFSAPSSGPYAITLSNERAALCAKQVRIDFVG